MQPAMPATNTDPPTRAERGQPLRRTAVGGEMHRVLIRIPDFRDPAPLPTPQPITTLPLSQQVQTFVVHQAHSALQPHTGRGKSRGTRAAPETGPTTIIAAPPLANLPPIAASHSTPPPPPVERAESRWTTQNNTPVNTASIDALMGAQGDDEDDVERDNAGESHQRTARRSSATSKLATVGRWVSELDSDDLHRIGRKLSTMATLWVWMQQPRIMLGAIGVLLLQFTGLAVLLEWNSPPANRPPEPKSSLAPAVNFAPDAIQTPLNPGRSSGPVQTGTLPQASTPQSNPLPEGPLTPTLAPPISKPIQTPLNTKSPTAQTSEPRFNTTPRLGGAQEQLPWETSQPATERPIVTPVAPDASANRPSPTGSLGQRPKSGTRLGGTIELPQQESPR